MKVIFITGPAGAGKTTIGKLLTNQLVPCANIEIDDIKHMNVQAFALDKQTPDGNIPYTAWDIVGQNIGLLTQNFTNNRYNVVIQGYLDSKGWKTLERIIPIQYKILLKPSLNVNIEWDSLRPAEDAMGEGIVKSHHALFENETFYSDFTIVDTSKQSVEDTVDQVLNIVNN